MHTTPPTPRIWQEYRALLRQGWGLVRAGGAKLAGLILVSQALITLIALPVISWLFREALRAGGMQGLDVSNFSAVTGLPITFGLIFVIVLLAFWMISLQFTSIVVLLRWPRLTLREFLSELWSVARRLLRPGSIPLALYLFLLLPFTGFGFSSAITQGIAVPPSVGAELGKSTSGMVIHAVFLLILAFINIRLALAVPLFVMTRGAKPLRSSWRLTRGLRASVPVVLAVLSALILGVIFATLLIIIAVLPTAATDAIAPQASIYVASYSFGIAQVLGYLASGFLTSYIAAILITRVRRADHFAPGSVAPMTRQAPQLAPAPRTAHDPGKRRWSLGWSVVAVATVMAIALGSTATSTIKQLSAKPETLVLGHRGFSGGGVENTIQGLEAAAAAGADLVEMDVMQTKDGKFVAMHDTTLSRLAGRSDAIKDLTLDELTQITVRDLQGHEAPIPSFADYATRALEIDMPLLVEIKLSGAETPDHVELLVEELESLGALDANIYHSLDPASVASLKRLRPDLSVGYTMPLAGGGIPDTPADFIVVEQWTATQEMQNAAHDAGLAFMAWTVNDDKGIREHLRRNSDGIVSDHPDVALAARDEMQGERGLAGVLLDTLRQFITVA